MATRRPARIPEDLARDMILNGWDEEPIGGIDSGSDISDVEDPEYCPSGHVRPSETQSAPAEQDQIPDGGLVRAAAHSSRETVDTVNITVVEAIHTAWAHLSEVPRYDGTGQLTYSSWLREQTKSVHLDSAPEGSALEALLDLPANVTVTWHRLLGGWFGEHGVAYTPSVGPGHLRG
ncbi:hypothetical protein MHYP_G00219980 [Metynnis hypsauchen]